MADEFKKEKGEREEQEDDASITEGSDDEGFSDSDVEKSVEDLLSLIDGSDSKDQEYQEEEEEDEEDEEEEDEEEEKESSNQKEEEQSEVSSLKSEIAELKALVKSMKKEGSEVEKPKKEEQKPFTIEVSDEQYDRALSTKEGFQEVMTDLLQKTVAKARELYLSEVPEIVQSEVSTQSKYKDTVLGFYQQHSDLIPHKDYVSYAYTMVERQNPEADVDSLLKMTAAKVRKDLNITSSKTPEKKKGKNPGLASSKGGKAPVDKKKLEGQEAEIAALLELEN